MFNKTVFLYSICFFLMLFGTLVLKIYVQDLVVETDQLIWMKSKLNNDIKVLKAEWSYLNNSERVSNLADKYLNLNKVKYKQIRYIDKENFDRVNNIPSLLQRANINWRYKSRTSILKVACKK